MRRLLAVFACALLFCATAFGFEIRGMHIDLRAEVMTMDALKSLADNAAKCGINTIIMEWEGTFPFDRNVTICNDEAYTADEVRGFVAHCAALGIDVIPLQNCFGHCEYILRHERYASLRESNKDFSQVCPCRIKEAKEVFRSIFSEVTSLHYSKYIHIGADETRLLGECPRCAAKVAGEGKSKLFCDYVKAMCEVVKELGKTPIIWADILTKFPEAAEGLPKDIVILDWNYGWDMNRFGDFNNIVSKGFEMWSAPALRSGPDDIYCTQWMKHFNNLRDYLDTTRKLGFKGVIETSWSTSGQYGYIYSNGWGAIDLQPIRQVYPLSGFDILQKAFCAAALSFQRFEPEAFIRNYCADTFGFDKAGVDVMWDYFNMPQNTISKKTAATLPDELSKALAVREKFSALKPKSGKTQFAHLALMLDIRINYLQFCTLKYRFEDKTFKASDRAALKKELEGVKRDCAALQKMFCKLNEHYLKHPERAFGAWGYAGEIDHLNNCL